MLVRLDKFSRLKESQILETIEISKKGRYLSWISSQPGMRPTSGADEFPINFFGDQLQKLPECRGEQKLKCFSALRLAEFLSLGCSLIS